MSSDISILDELAQEEETQGDMLGSKLYVKVPAMGTTPVLPVTVRVDQMEKVFERTFRVEIRQIYLVVSSMNGHNKLRFHRRLRR